MTKKEIQNIIDQQKNLNDLPNSELIKFMDTLSLEFDDAKKNIISLTYHLDNMEILYNKILKTYQERKNGK
jgi:hypothetical protein